MSVRVRFVVDNVALGVPPPPPLSPPHPPAYLCFLYPYHSMAQWLRHCATNRKVAGSIPDGVFGIFHWHNPSDRTMALGSTQPLTEMSTRSISLGLRRPVRKTDNLTTILCRCHVIWEFFNFLEPSGPLQACNRTALPLPLCVSFHQCCTSIFNYMLLLPEGQTGEAWEPSKKQCSYGNRGTWDGKLL
jgi:hypothetical protein